MPHKACCDFIIVDLGDGDFQWVHLGAVIIYHHIGGQVCVNNNFYWLKSVETAETKKENFIIMQ